MLSEFESTRLPAHDGEDSGADLRMTFLRGMGRSWPWVWLATLLGAAAGLAYGLIQPNEYVSTTKLLLRAGAREQITPESLVGFEEERPAAPLTMVDELQMLSDVAIFEQVARELGPDEVLMTADPQRDDGSGTFAPVRWMHQAQASWLRWLAQRRESLGGQHEDPLASAAKSLAENTTIVNEPGSNVIVVTHRSTSPEKAQRVAAALASAFIERHRGQFSIQTLVETSRTKLERAKESRDSAANAYVEFMNQTADIDVEPQAATAPALQTEVTAIESELFAARVRKKGIAKQRAMLTGRLEDVPAEVEITGPQVMIPNEEYETQLLLKRNLLTQKQSLPLENRPIEETKRLQRHFDEQIAECEQKLKTLPKVVAQDPGLRENTAHLQLSTRVEDLDVEEQDVDVKIELLEQRLGVKRSEATEQRKQVLITTLRRKDLDSTREAADTYYKQMLARHSVLEALGNIERHDDPNLRVLQAATFDRDKVAPKRGSLVIKGMLAGLLIGVAFAMLRQRFDRRLQPQLFERGGLPVLGVVPEVPALRYLRVKG